MIRSKGIVADAAKLLNCRPETVLRTLDENPEIQEELDLCHTELVDEALKSAKDLVDNRDREMTKFVLNTFGKRRGIKETKNVQISGDPKNPIRKEIDLSGLSDEELEILSKMSKKEKDNEQ